jgi:hypothetical protein
MVVGGRGGGSDGDRAGAREGDDVASTPWSYRRAHRGCDPRSAGDRRQWWVAAVWEHMEAMAWRAQIVGY